MWRNQITGKIKVYALVVQSTAENSGDVLFELIWWVWPCVWFTWIQFDEICHVICKWTARHKYAGKLVDWIQLGGPLSGINSSTCWRQTRSLRFSRLSFRLGRLVEIAISLIGWKLWKVNMKTAGKNPPPGVHFFCVARVLKKEWKIGKRKGTLTIVSKTRQVILAKRESFNHRDEKSGDIWRLQWKNYSNIWSGHRLGLLEMKAGILVRTISSTVGRGRGF